MAFFGTDGVRGIANKELTPQLAFSLGVAAAEELGQSLVVGRDTRRSGTMLECALAAGVAAAGGTVLSAGMVPTPAVAFLIGHLQAAGGAVVSASHNSAEYNGIKFFDGRGFKLSRDQEQRIEGRVQELMAAPPDSATASAALADAASIGTVQAIDDASELYVAHAVASLAAGGIDLSGLKVALDCAHGAAARTSPAAIERLGAEVVAINTDYDGDDINEGCGSTHLEAIQELVRNSGADAGIAHDGDADRTIACDAAGNILDGDFILAICANDLLSQGRLQGQQVISTVMANLGFIKAMERLGIAVEQTDVGDSNVLAAMRAGTAMLGGEQSGHIIFLEHNSTGDGLITALQLLGVMRRSGKDLAGLAQVMQKYPQTLINVPDVRKDDLSGAEAVWQAQDEVQQRLDAAGGGRVLIRASGTEPLVRVMVEAASREQADEQAQHLADVVKAALG